MKNTRDKGTKLWDVFPSNDPKYKKWNDTYTDNVYTDRKSDKLKYLIKSKFHDTRYLSEIFTDIHKRDELRLSYRILTWFGKRDLNVKVRLPEKPNIYYVDKNWYKTGDYYIDPVEIWWSEHGKQILKNWEGVCSIQKAPIINEDILQSIREQHGHGENDDWGLDTNNDDADYIGELKLKDNDDNKK